MALRITQSMMYSSHVQNMNSNLTALMDSSIQSASQKRINRPSDDAVGTGRVLSFRTTLDRLDLFQSNINTAKGWINTMDKVLSDTLPITRIMEKAEQGASGTYDGDNRMQIAEDLRGMFMELLSRANTSFNNRYVFAGHKTDTPPYALGLGVTTKDPNLATEQFHVGGDSAKTVLIQAVGPAAPGTTLDAKDAEYRYSADGGKTWQNATVDTGIAPPYNPGQIRINAGGVGVVMNGTSQVTTVNTALDKDSNNGTWMYVRPTAIYKGDDNRTEVITPYGATANTVTSSADGYFTRDVAARIESIAGGVVTYSYSTDDGANWTQATAAMNGTKTTLPLPGGYLNLDGTLTSGDQFVVHPRRADINLNISESDAITLNMVGMNIFGGMYQDPDPTVSPGYPTVVPGQANLFESIGKLIGYAETNSQQGMQESLEEIKKALAQFTNAAAEAGGRANRLTTAEQNITLRRYSEEDGLSGTEDVDLTELTTRMAQQQLAYNSVLKSASMVMQMSLVNFL